MHFSPSPACEPGHVTLVGAGPGDPELLTLKAVKALQAADVILFDDLIAPAILDFAKQEAKRLLVGKRGYRSSCKQEEINALMLTLARQGKQVVRLKSGDPMLFGRAGEEIAALRQAGIAVTVIPGISAAFGLAARLGVSLTHRDHSHSLRLVTGHSRRGGLPEDLDWSGLADPSATLVVYMGGHTARDFAARLLAEGLAPTTPVVIAEAVSTPAEVVTTSRLDHLASDGVITTGGPVLIGIGRVFAPLPQAVATAPADAQTILKAAG